jgi:hypothetical protein
MFEDRVQAGFKISNRSETICRISFTHDENGSGAIALGIRPGPDGLNVMQAPAQRS